MRGIEYNESKCEMINLMQGDCLELMKTIPDGSVDMVLTDPPYGTTTCTWDSVIPFEPMWEHLNRITKKNGAIVLTASQPFSSALVMSNPKMFKYEWVWRKPKGTGHLNAKRQPLRNHENVLVFYYEQVGYNPQKTQGDPYRCVNNAQYQGYGKQVDMVVTDNKDGKRYPVTVQEFSSNMRGSLHPTQKPVALMEYLIRTYTNEGETVLDFTMGSGTTGVAAKNLDRDFIGIELDKDYYNIANKRIENTNPLGEFM